MTTTANFPPESIKAKLLDRLQRSREETGQREETGHARKRDTRGNGTREETGQVRYC